MARADDLSDMLHTEPLLACGKIKSTEEDWGGEAPASGSSAAAALMLTKLLSLLRCVALLIVIKLYHVIIGILDAYHAVQLILVGVDDVNIVEFKKSPRLRE